MGNKYENMLEQLYKYFPSFRDETVDWWPSGRQFVTVRLMDGTIFEFNALDNSIKRIRDRDYLEDEKVLSKEFAYNLRKHIQTSNMTQTEIAEKLGVTNAMLSRYVNGASIPGLTKAYRLANILGVRVSDLLDSVYGDVEE